MKPNDIQLLICIQSRNIYISIEELYSILFEQSVKNMLHTRTYHHLKSESTGMLYKDWSRTK